MIALLISLLAPISPAPGYLQLAQATPADSAHTLLAPPSASPGRSAPALGGPGFVTGTTPSYQTIIPPGGGGSAVVTPNGNGTSTVTGTNGRTGTVATPK